MERKIPSKYEQFVITDLPRFVEMPGHNRPAPSWIYPDMFPGVPDGLTARPYKQIIGHRAQDEASSA